MNSDHSWGSPPSPRLLKVGEQIKRVLSMHLAKEPLWSEELGTVHLTISEVRMSPDLKNARIYILPFGHQSGADEKIKKIILLLDASSYELRRVIGKSVGLKYLPRLFFVYDTSFDEAQYMEKLIKRSVSHKED
jgi:ribosome-binding factor A